MRTKRTLEERFMAKVRKDDDGCWRWTGAVHVASGYGTLSPDFMPRSPHRWSYTHFVGPVPDGLVIDHTCHTRACPGGPACLHRRCVNPAHLEAVTQKVNIQRGQTAREHAVKTHCPFGHPYSPDNTYLQVGELGGLKRSCRACSLARSRARRESRHPAQKALTS